MKGTLWSEVVPPSSWLTIYIEVTIGRSVSTTYRGGKEGGQSEPRKEDIVALLFPLLWLSLLWQDLNSKLFRNVGDSLRTYVVIIIIIVVVVIRLSWSWAACLTRSGFSHPEVTSMGFPGSFSLLMCLDLPCSGLVIHSGEILTTRKSHELTWIKYIIILIASFVKSSSFRGYYCHIPSRSSSSSSKEKYTHGFIEKPEGKKYLEDQSVDERKI